MACFFKNQTLVDNVTNTLSVNVERPPYVVCLLWVRLRLNCGDMNVSDGDRKDTWLKEKTENTCLLSHTSHSVSHSELLQPASAVSWKVPMYPGAGIIGPPHLFPRPALTWFNVTLALTMCVCAMNCLLESCVFESSQSFQRASWHRLTLWFLKVCILVCIGRNLFTWHRVTLMVMRTPITCMWVLKN